MELFTIQCTTCRARLVVHDEDVIGDILACPKCSSMVHVVPPPGWNSTTVEVAPQDPAVWPPTHDAAPAAPRAVKAKAAAIIPPALPPRPAPVQPAAVAAGQPSAPVPPPVLAAAKVAAQPPLPAPVAGPALPPAAAAVPPTIAALPPASSAVPPPVPTLAATAGVAAKSLAASKLAPSRWTPLTNWARQEWKFLTAGLGAGIVLGGSVWLILALQTPSVPPADEVTVEAPANVTPATDAAPSSPTRAGDAPVVKTLPPPVEALAENPVATAEPPHVAADRLTEQPQDPIDEAPDAAQATEKSEAALSPPAVSEPTETDKPSPPVASAPRPTIKLEPAPAEAPAAAVPAEEMAESIIDSAASDDSVEAPAAVRTPAADSPGVEHPEITAADVDERLSRQLPAAQFSKVPLFQFIEFVSEFTGLPIQLDEPALKRAGKNRQSPVTIKLNQTTAGDALRTALSELGLATSLREGVVVVTAAPNAKAE